MKVLLIISICLLTIYAQDSSTYPVIDQFKPYVEKNSTFQCVAKLQPVLSALNEDDQKLMYDAFVKAKGNSTSDNDMKLCFDRDVIKKGLKDAVKNDAKNSGKRLTEFSKKIRNSMGCISTAFKNLKVKEATTQAYTQSLNDLLLTQTSTNQCSSEFIKVLYNTLGRRRRYLLLNNADLLTFGRMVNNTIVDFPWDQDEVNTITPAFIKYGNCFSGLPDTIVQNINEALVSLSEDSVCQETTLLRFLQDSTTTTPNTTATVTTNTTATATTNTIASTNVTSVNTTDISASTNVTSNNSTITDINNNTNVVVPVVNINNTPYYDDKETIGKSLVKINLSVKTKLLLNTLIEEYL